MSRGQRCDCFERAPATRRSNRLVPKRTTDRIEYDSGMAIVPRRHPILAAVLGLVVVGLGHAYLRRWVRGLWWASLSIVVGVLFVPEGVSLGAGEPPAPTVLAPVLTVVAVSAADAFAVAFRGTDSEESDRTCPECGKSLDEGLSFCQWCTAEVDDIAE